MKMTPNTGMVVTTDIGDLRDIHPANKQVVGRRLGLWALAKTYGHQGLVYSGPLYKSHRVEARPTAPPRRGGTRARERKRPGDADGRAPRAYPGG